MIQECYCCSGKEFARCCGPILDGSAKASTPEELMRARYSAHCVKNYEFLVESVHPDHRDGLTKEEIEQWSGRMNWTGMEVHSATPGPTDDIGYVSFTAHYTINDVPQLMKEDSVFSRVDGNWLYVDGKVRGQEPYQREQPKVGRNDPCPCGSGKKYKKCCGK